MKISKDGLKLLKFLSGWKGEKVDIYEFWNFYYNELSYNRSQVFRRLRDAGLVKYEKDKAYIMHVVLTSKGKRVLQENKKEQGGE